MEPYITNRLHCGLGNQLFQIATAYSLGLDLGIEYKISFSNNIPAEGQSRDPRNYRDSLYTNITFVDEELYTDQTVVKTPQWIYFDIRSMVEETLRRHGRACIAGFYQSDLYFSHRRMEIRHLFTPHDGFDGWLRRVKPAIAAKYSELLDDHSYVFIGVRRGDYLKPENIAIHNPCGKTYYAKALNRMPAERYYLLSDDIAWCKRTFVGPEYRFIELGPTDDTAQFALMTLFRRFIISNSSFYWWGSYLSHYEDCDVVAPDKWIFGEGEHRCYSIYRDDMTVIARPVEAI